MRKNAWRSTSAHKPATVTERIYSTPLTLELIKSSIQLPASQVFPEIRSNVINFWVCQVAVFQITFSVQSPLYEEAHYEILIVRTFTGSFYCHHTENGSFIT
jgi:hypothetical protein